MTITIIQFFNATSIIARTPDISYCMYIFYYILLYKYNTHILLVQVQTILLTCIVCIVNYYTTV